MIVKISGMPPYDGEYPFKVQALTVREQALIKRLSGCRPLEYDDALDQGDAAFIAALVIIAVQRGRPNDRIREDVFLDSDLEGVVFDTTDDDDVEDDAPLRSETGTHPTPSGERSGSGSASLGTTPTLSGPRSLESPASRPKVSAG